MIGLGLLSCQDAVRDLFMSSPDLFSGIDPDSYREACSQFATGVAVATVLAADGTPHGLTVSSVTAVSIDPPLILICIDFSAAPIAHFRDARFFAINVLGASQRELSVAFAAQTEGRFENVEWKPGKTGAPLIQGCLATMECALERVVDAGDHAVFFGLLVRAALEAGEPLLYFNRTYRTLL